MGIPVVNTRTNKAAKLLGKGETVRWMNPAIYQGQSAKKGLTMVSIAGLHEIPVCSPNSFGVL
jgi:peptidylprolyl isomerase domain and WD repeat-containing protein 1